MLAGLVLKEQGIDVRWISFETPFFSAKRAISASERLGIPITVKDITPEYIPMLKNPPCGYGQNMNPCMDCHALMFSIAGKIMTEEGYDFMFSGEVAGQRPFSQTKSSLRYVARQSGFDGYILRPLSALLLPETIPEQKGLVNRNKLLGISGRSRKPQMELAEKFGLTDYPSPAGGCLLTEKSFSARLRDLFNFQESYTERDFHLLRYGRHFRLSPQSKLVVGRTRHENEQLMELAKNGDICILKVKDFPGPTALLTGEKTHGILMLAASICIGYSKAPGDEPVCVAARSGGNVKNITMMGIPPAKVRHLMI